MQRFVAHEARPFGAERGLAYWGFEAAGERIPIQPNRPICLAPPYLDDETMHRHYEFQRLDPLDGDTRGVLAGEVFEFRAVFASDRLGALLLPDAF